MSMQSHRFAPTQPVVTRTIVFVLPGRRTLSEHLPAEIIELPVSLAQRSAYLRKIIVVHTLEKPNDRWIKLTGVDSVGFRFYVEWLRSGRIDFHASAASKPGSGLLLRDCFDLMFAHIVGSLFDEHDFQDYVIDVMARNLSASQTPDLKVLEEVFLEKGISNVLRQFVIDRMFAVERRMLGMMRGTVQQAVGGGAGCEYHVHEVGKCYRDNVKYAHKNAVLADTNVETNDSNTQYVEGTPYSATTTSANCTDRIWSYAMSNTQHVGSDKWCRKVHGSRRNVEPPDLQRYEKPLPTILPLTPGQSTSLPFSRPNSSSSLESPATSDAESEARKDVEIPSTQQLIQECLRRIPSVTDQANVSSLTSRSASQAARPEAILECLKRLKLLPADAALQRDSAATPDNSSQACKKDATSKHKNTDDNSELDIADTASPHSSASVDTHCEREPSGRSSPKQASPSVSPVLHSLELGPQRSIDDLSQLRSLSVSDERRHRPQHEVTRPYSIAGPYKQAERLEYCTPKNRRRPLSHADRMQTQSRYAKDLERRGKDVQQRPDTLETRTVLCELPGESSASRALDSKVAPARDASQPRLYSLKPDRAYSHTLRSHPPSPPATQYPHTYAQLGFSTPRPRIVDAQDSKMLLSEAPQNKHDELASAFGIGRNSGAMDKKQRQRWLIGTSLPPSAQESLLPYVQGHGKGGGSVKRKPTPDVVSKGPSMYLQRYVSPTPTRAPSKRDKKPKTPPSSLPKQTPTSTPSVESSTAELASPPPASHAPALESVEPLSDFPFSACSFLPMNSPTLKRKPAPERGADWLEQQGRNPWAEMRGGGEGEKVKKCRRSRFGELWREGVEGSGGLGRFCRIEGGEGK